jgi:hypothetical protein
VRRETSTAGSGGFFVPFDVDADFVSSVIVLAMT